MGGLLGIPASFGAALGIVAVFCGAVNCPIASLILSVELFGAGELSYFAIACGVSYMLSGYYGIYQSQEIRYSKLKPEKTKSMQNNSTMERFRIHLRNRSIFMQWDFASCANSNVKQRF